MMCVVHGHLLCPHCCACAWVVLRTTVPQRPLSPSLSLCHHWHRCRFNAGIYSAIVDVSVCMCGSHILRFTTTTTPIDLTALPLFLFRLISVAASHRPSLGLTLYITACPLTHAFTWLSCHAPTQPNTHKNFSKALFPFRSSFSSFLLFPFVYFYFTFFFLSLLSFFLDRFEWLSNMSSTAVFAGYAYYSTNGDGYAYALTNTSAPTTLGRPVIVVNGVTRATDFFPFLFLVAGGAFTLFLFILLTITFCCRCHVTKLETRYWRLQHAYAEVNGSLVHEVLHRTPQNAPKRQPSMKRQASTSSMRSAQPQQQQQQSQMSRYNSTTNVRSQPQSPQPQPVQRQASVSSMRSQKPQQQQQQMAAPGGVYPPNANAWGLPSDAQGMYPPPQPPVQQPYYQPSPSVPAANMTNSNPYDYSNMYGASVSASAAPVTYGAPAPILSPASPQTEHAAAAETLRRRESKVRFL